MCLIWNVDASIDGFFQRAVTDEWMNMKKIDIKWRLVLCTQNEMWIQLWSTLYACSSVKIWKCSMYFWTGFSSCDF